MRRSLPAALLVLAAVGCSSTSVPAESAFAAGTCRTAAPDVRAVGEVLPDMDDGGTVDAAAKEALRAAQDRIDAVAAGADGPVASALRDLVEKIGIVRIRADGNTYEPELGEQLTRSYEQVLQACDAA